MISTLHSLYLMIIEIVGELEATIPLHCATKKLFVLRIYLVVVYEGMIRFQSPYNSRHQVRVLLRSRWSQ